jgi:hypothetical protein
MSPFSEVAAIADAAGLDARALARCAGIPASRVSRAWRGAEVLSLDEMVACRDAARAALRRDVDNVGKQGEESRSTSQRDDRKES